MISQLLKRRDELSDIAMIMYGDLYICHEDFWGSPLENEMNELIAALQAIESDPTVTVPSSMYLTDGSYEELHPLVQKVVDLADTELITNKGSCNWAAHKLLKLAGLLPS